MTVAEVRAAVRRSAAAAGIAADPARDGSGRVDPGGDRRDHAAHGPPRPPADRPEEPVPGRRRGAELRRQRPDPARRAVRRHLDPAGGGRRRRRAGRGPVHLAPAARTTRARPTRWTASAARSWARASPTTRSARSSTARRAKYHHFDDEDELCDRVAELLAAEKVVGWVQGRMEFGPRALGSRSILGDARSRQMQSVMNLKIKFRESFRPFAPSCCRSTWTSTSRCGPARPSPYMLLVAPVRAEQASAARRVRSAARGPGQAQDAALRRAGHHPRRLLGPRADGRPAAARPLLPAAEGFEAKTGCPVMINTSFNVRGEPIVCTPEDAYRCFMATNMDVLVLEDFVLLKDEQPGAQQPDRRVPGPIPIGLRPAAISSYCLGAGGD